MSTVTIASLACVAIVAAALSALWILLTTRRPRED